MRLLSCLFVVLFVVPAFADRCGSGHLRFFTMREMFTRFQKLGFSVSANRNRLAIERRRDRIGHILFAEGKIVGNGVLSLGFLTKSETAPRRMAGFEGRELFDLMLLYFHRKVDSVMGEWISGGDNLETYQALRSAGLGAEQAAKQTWTGKQAERHGFTGVEVLEESSVDGVFTKVIVIFFRPS